MSRDRMTDSGLSGVSGESCSSTPASKANNDRCLSRDEGISRGSSGWSKKSGNSGNTLASYSRYGLSTKPHIKPSCNYTASKCDSIQIMVSEFTDSVFSKPYMESLKKFDERMIKLYDVLGTKIYDIREKIIKASPLDATSIAFTPGGESLLSCPLPLTPDGNDLCCSPEEASCTGEENTGPIWILLPNRIVDVDSLETINGLLMQTSSKNKCLTDITMSRGSGIQKEYESTEVTKDQILVSDPLQQKSDLHIMVRGTTGSYALITYDLTNYNQIDSFHRSSQELDPENKITLSPDLSKAFSFNDKISILNAKRGNSGTWKINLYCLDTEGQLATWKMANFSSSFSDLLLDFHNSFVVSYKCDEIILASIVNNRIIFHIVSKSIHGNKRNSATFTLPKLQSRTAKFIMQSYIVVSTYIYCSLLQLGVSACICRFKLLQNQRNTTSVQLVDTWHINDHSNLQNCFISALNAQVFINCCKVADNKTTIEVKRLKSDLTAESIASFQFPCIVKINTVSIVPCENLVIAVIYHNTKTNKCYIKKIDMASHI